MLNVKLFDVRHLNVQCQSDMYIECQTVRCSTFECRMSKDERQTYSVPFKSKVILGMLDAMVRFNFLFGDHKVQFHLILLVEDLLNNFSQQRDSWKHCLFFMANTQNEYVMMYCLTVMEVGFVEINMFKNCTFTNSVR